MPIAITHEVAEKQSPTNPNRHSKYHIIVNTNKKPADDEDAKRLVEALRDATHEVFTSNTSLRRIVEFNIPHHEWNEKYIRSVDVRQGPEIGTHKFGGRAHNHIILNIKHRSNITLKHREKIIKEEYLKTGKLDPWNVTNPLVKIILIRDWSKAVRKYIAKNQAVQTKKNKKNNN